MDAMGAAQEVYTTQISIRSGIMNRLTQLRFTHSRKEALEMLKDAHTPKKGHFAKVNTAIKKEGKMLPGGFLNTNQPEKFKVKFIKRANMYITKNGMTDSKVWDRKSLSTLDTIVMDIDCHDKELPFEDVFAATHCLYDLLLENEIFPNLVCITGRGVQLWWFVDPLPALDNLIAIYNAIVEKLIISVKHILEEKLPAIIKRDKLKMSVPKYNAMKALQNFSVDLKATKNYSGLVRLPGSFNTWTGRFCDFSYQHKERIDILKEYFDERDPNQVKEFVPYENKASKKARKKNRTAIKTTENVEELLQVREELYYGLVELRKERGETLIGVRNIMTHSLAALYMSAGYTREEAIAAVRRLNQAFDKPLSERELIGGISTALKKHYWYTNAKLINDLKMTEDEKVLLGFFAKNKREEIAVAKRTVRKARDEKILKMCADGWTQVDIAEELGVSQPTVCRVLNKNGVVKYGKRAVKSGLKNSMKRRYIVERLRVKRSDTSSLIVMHQFNMMCDSLKKYSFFTLFINIVCLQTETGPHQRKIAYAPSILISCINWNGIR